MADGTYIRKVDDRFEYGYITYAKNFRKQKDAHEPIDTVATCAEAMEGCAALTEEFLRSRK